MPTSGYDDFAHAYSVENESGLFNAYYERPAMLRLAGNVSGRRILDTGCGSGPLAELRRVLKPGGRLMVSVNHPAAYAIGYPQADYFALTKYSEDYVMDGQTVWLTWRMRSPLPGSASRRSASRPLLRTPP